MSEKFIVTNFAYGTGPYLRMMELSIAFNDELERRGMERMSVIIPLVYGEKQKKIILEEFGEHDKKYPKEFLLDACLGGILRRVFYYGDRSFEQSLKVWVKEARQASEIAREYLSGVMDVETLAGERIRIDGHRIAVELNRSPRLRFDVAPAYMSTFGYLTEIFQAALKVGKEEIDVDHELLTGGVQVAKWVEGEQKIRAVAYPGTFSGMPDYKSRYGGEVLTPPNTSQIFKLKNDNFLNLKDGIMVTVTGIPGLERLYHEALELGLILYTNDTEVLQGGTCISPREIKNPGIKLHFARAGWGSVWLSIFAGTPIVVPEFDSKDDPEIYFNNKIIEELGIGIIYRGQPLREILDSRDTVRDNCVKLEKKIMDKWGTLDGNQYCAKLFADDFLGVSNYT